MVLAILWSFNGVTLGILMVLVTLLLLVSRSLKWSAKIPPGPPGYPIVGNLPMILGPGRFINKLRPLRAKYGNVYSIRFGQGLTVVINGLDTLKEAFVKQADDFSDRLDTYVIKNLIKEKGIVFSSGELWKQTRSFSLAALRNFGFGKKSLESRVIEEVEQFLNHVESNSGKAFKPKHIIQVGTSNIICSIVFGKRFEYDEERFIRLAKLLEEIVCFNSAVNLVNIFPWLRFFPGDTLKLKRIIKNRKEMVDYFMEQVTEHRLTYDDENPRDFIDAFLKQSDNQRADDEIFTDENLITTIMSLFVAGTETTTTAIRWAILQLMYHKGIQDRLRQEINTVVGTSRYPSINDKPEMPYYEAFVTETLRFGNIAPLSVPHGSRKDIQFRGMSIPKGSSIFPNLDSVHFDPLLFENPSKFNPDRFLGKDGKLNGKEKDIVAFSLGRRACLGESLARLELFSFLTTLVQRFQLLPEDPDQMTTGEPSVGQTSGPPEYSLRAVKLN